MDDQHKTYKSLNTPLPKDIFDMMDTVSSRTGVIKKRLIEDALRQFLKAKLASLGE